MDSKDTLKSMFEAQIDIVGNQTAAVFGNASLTYDALNKRANQLAHYLLELGIKRDTPVAVCLERSLDLLVVIIAILKAGGAYLPLDAAQPENRLLFILEDSQAPILITNASFKKSFKQYEKQILVLDKISKKLNKESASNPLTKITPQQLAYIIYTSGSTGTPKGVLIEHKSVMNYCLFFREYDCKLSQKRIDFSSNHIFDMAITNSIASLMQGLTVVICDDKTKNDLRNYLCFLKENKVNFIKLTPSFFKVLLQEVTAQSISLPDLESIMLGGENVSVMDCKSWLEFYPHHTLYNEYGPTEATVGISIYTITRENTLEKTVNVPVGKPGPNIYCYILDKDQNQVQNHEMGELYIGGSCLARGYLNQPELTKRQFIKDPFSKDKNARLYKTGDLCSISEDGVIEYYGRIDNQVKIRGFRIEPQEIESRLTQHEAIDRALVIDCKDATHEASLVAYYILKEGCKELSSNQLRLYLQKDLPKYMIPAAFVKIDGIPLTANGKLDRAALPKPLFESSTPYKKPRTLLQKMLADIWRDELSVDSIGLDDDFFELGGHSLSAARIVSKINNIIGKDLSLPDFYKATSISKLAKLLKKTKNIKRKKGSFNRRSYKNVNEIPLSDFQFLLWMANIFESRAKKLNITARKRFKGRINREALQYAFDALLRKQEVLTYNISTFYPIQRAEKNYFFTVTEKNLDSLSFEQSENALEASMEALGNLYPWKKNKALINVKLFNLKDDMSEIQISMPHIISDDVSPDILFREMSKFYLNFHNPQKLSSIKPDKQFKNYALKEQHDLGAHLTRDTQFWKDYLKETQLFAFPKQYVVKDMNAEKLHYSSYIEIPKAALNNLRQYCALHQFSMKDGLSAVLALALKNSCDNYQKSNAPIFMNVIKSTRDDPIYDETIGCFLRLEPVKVALSRDSTLITIAEQIHQSTIDTSPYQNCSNLIKLTSTKTLSNNNSRIMQFFLKSCISIYTSIFGFSELRGEIFKLCGGKLATFKRDNHFLININVHNNFLMETLEKPATLFGLDMLHIAQNHQDLLKIDYVFEASFMQKEGVDENYLVISANLQPDFRERIGREAIRIMGSKI